MAGNGGNDGRTPREIIQQQVDRAIETETFNLEAVQRIQEMREDWARLREENGALKTELEETRERMFGFKEERDAFEARLSGVEEREAKLAAREHALDVKEARVEAEKDCAADMKAFVAEVVRAPVVRRVVDKPVMDPDGYVHSQREETVETRE